MIDDEILAGRIPRLGTITTGRGTEATSRKGGTYARPTRAKTLVFHCNDVEVANAIQMRFGGDVLTDSPTWDCDVVTDVREIPVTALPQGFRQSLELWRAAECVRRCDGVTMTTRDGRPSSDPCVCAAEMEAGAERACKPSTILPVLIDLDVERFGVWEVRSNAWGTAAALKGSVRALTLAGAGSGSIPAVLSMVDRQVRDGAGKVHDVSEMHLTIAVSHASLAAGVAPSALPAGDPPPDARRSARLVEWAGLQQRAHAVGLRDQLAAAWRSRGWAGRTVEELDDDDLGDWLMAVDVAVSDAEAATSTETAANGPLPAGDRLPGTT